VRVREGELNGGGVNGRAGFGQVRRSRLAEGSWGICTAPIILK